MGWNRVVRSWSLWIGLALAVAAFTAVPEIVRAGHVPGPAWLSKVLVAAAGLAVAAWKPLLTARTEVRAARLKAREERAGKGRDALADLPRAAGRLPLVGELTDRGLLDIHQAIPLPAGATGPGLSPDLPTYVLRDIDADLRTFLAGRAAVGGFALLVGKAATGKTRTAYEALRQAVPDWPMLLPVSGAEINTMVAGGTLPPRSVIWLNEIQEFVTGGDPLTGATVRRLLADTERPVLLIGTIWPDTYDRMCARPANRPPAPASTSAPDGEHDAVRAVETVEDNHRHAREVLALARRFDLHAFTPAEWDRARDSAGLDPRLHTALRYAPDGEPGVDATSLTQILAAAPELIRRWEHADDPYGKAVLTAAVTARRCGHPPTLPEAVLRALAEHLLPGTDRATAPTTWLTDALTWARTPIHLSGTIAPLLPYGERTGQTDGYRVSDILTDHTAPTSPAARMPDAGVWDVLIAAAGAEACGRIADFAYRGKLTAQARAAVTRAAEAGNTKAMSNLGVLLHETGEPEAARTWYTRAAETGHTGAMSNLGIMLYQAGDVERARIWWTRAAEAGHTRAMFNLGVLLRRAGETEQASAWWTRAAEAGHTGAMSNLGNLLRRAGETEEARTWYYRAAEDGHASAMFNLGVLLDKAGEGEQARTWYTRAAKIGQPSAMYNLGSLLHEAGGAEEARTWYTRAAETGHTKAMFNLGNLLRRAGETEEARTWYTRAAEAGHARSREALEALEALTSED